MKLMTAFDEPILSVAEEKDSGARIDQFAAQAAGLTRSAATRLIEEGKITVNGKVVAKNTKLKPSDRVEILIPAPDECEVLPENIPLDIVYEDDDLIVVNKPVGMVVHPAPGNPTGTLVNALLYHCGESLSGIGGVKRPGIVHRIDKETAGLLVVAKNDESHQILSEQLKGHRINRIYYAIALGNFPDDAGTVNAPIGRHPIDRKKMAVIKNVDYTSREAVTHWRVEARGSGEGQNFTLLRCELETGRTHQIRVHLSSIGHPLLGDSLYGGGGTRFERVHKALIEGQCLQAAELSFRHPKTGEEMHFCCPLEARMEKLVKILFG